MLPGRHLHSHLDAAALPPRCQTRSADANMPTKKYSSSAPTYSPSFSSTKLRNQMMSRTPTCRRTLTRHRIVANNRCPHACMHGVSPRASPPHCVHFALAMSATAIFTCVRPPRRPWQRKPQHAPDSIVTFESYRVSDQRPGTGGKRECRGGGTIVEVHAHRGVERAGGAVHKCSRPEPAAAHMALYCVHISGVVWCALHTVCRLRSVLAHCSPVDVHSSQPGMECVPQFSTI